MKVNGNIAIVKTRTWIWKKMMIKFIMLFKNISQREKEAVQLIKYTKLLKFLCQEEIACYQRPLDNPRMYKKV